MSRIGKAPITVPGGVTVTIDGPGGTNVSLTTGKAARIYTRGSVVMVEVVDAAANIDVST